MGLIIFCTFPKGTTIFPIDHRSVSFLFQLPVAVGCPRSQSHRFDRRESDETVELCGLVSGMTW